MTILLILVIAVIVLIACGYGVYKYKNRRPKPDYFEYYKTQDKAPAGKIGVFATSIIMTEDHSHEMFHNVT